MLSYKKLYNELKLNINQKSYEECFDNNGRRMSLKEYFTFVSNCYNLNYFSEELEYKKDIYTTYVLDCRVLCCAFVITLKEININQYEFYITPIDYEYIHYTTNTSKDCLIDVFYGSMTNCFGKLAIELDEFNYEYILLRKFKKELLTKPMFISNIEDVYKYLLKVDKKK